MIKKPKDNDFTVKVANVNGTGSASANTLLMKSFFRMGIPVAGKNYFPSNIQGLPTWYEVRVSEAGWLGRRGGIDMMVAMNPQTWDQDVKEIEWFLRAVYQLPLHDTRPEQAIGAYWPIKGEFDALPALKRVALELLRPDNYVRVELLPER